MANRLELVINWDVRAARSWFYVYLLAKRRAVTGRYLQWFAPYLTAVALGASLFAFAATGGCTSLQYTGRDGKPAVIGLASAEIIPAARGNIYRITAPGISLRIHSVAPGFTVGWHQLTLFYPSSTSSTNLVNRPVAVQTRCAGINIAPWQIMLGVDREFAIPVSATSGGMVQCISYSANEPTNSVIERKELR